jgi:hypothetical protein
MPFYKGFSTPGVKTPLKRVKGTYLIYIFAVLGIELRALCTPSPERNLKGSSH